MVVIDKNIKIKDRKHAASLLAQLLREYHPENAVVTGIPPGGAALGFHIAKELNLPMKVISCKEIEHPRDSRKSIGSICESEKMISDYERGIPADYISNQIIRLQHNAKIENELYNQKIISLRNKTVILVIDKLKNADALLASLRCIKKENPHKVIVAVAFADPEAARVIAEAADEFVFLHTEATHFHEDFDTIKDEETKHFFDVHY